MAQPTSILYQTERRKITLMIVAVTVLMIALSSSSRSIMLAFQWVRLLTGKRADTLSGLSCDQSYTIEILSIDPLVMYINNFITDFEAQYFLDKYTPDFEHSLVYGDDFESVVDREYRTSQSAFIPRADPVSSCLYDRMRKFLGNVQHMGTEALQLVKYEVSEKFNIHYDWFDRLNNDTFDREHYQPYNRLGSIFVYLNDNCTGGETFFPEVKGVARDADGEKYSRTEDGMGLLVKPKRGNAVFWNNLHMNGSGDIRLVHAGMPVRSGTKVGLNMFSYYHPDLPIIGD